MLPGGAYTKGFLRTYAEFLGLDGRLYVDEYNARLAQLAEEAFVPEVSKSRGRASGVVFRTATAAVLVAAAIGGVVAWRDAGTPARPTIDSAAAAPKAHKHPLAHETKPAVAPKPTFTLIRAARDESWLSVRIGGPDGREIFRGLLTPGHVLKLGLQRSIWMRMGRPLALDIRIGKTLVVGLPDAPANLYLTRDGPRR